jgi:ABC-type uncharacterized transport system substrate-binding protein
MAMRRREFIAGLGGAAVWPLAARAQQPERMRRIGVLTPFADAAEGQARLTAFAQGLEQSGWTIGQNVRIDYRRGDGKAATMLKHALELVALAPDVILASSSTALAPLLEATRTVPSPVGPAISMIINRANNSGVETPICVAFARSPYLT